MQFLAAALQEYLQGVMSTRLSRSDSARVQPVVVGPPVGALRALFRLLTGEGEADWSVSTAAGGARVVVLLVDREQERGHLPSGSTGSLSQHCWWDYAVALRNSIPAVLTLAAPGAWDARPESMANATETIGTPLRRAEAGWTASQPWPFLLRKAASHLPAPVDVIRQALHQFANDCMSLDAPSREQAPWLAIDSLIAPIPADTSAANWLARAVGLPAIGNVPPSLDVVREARRVLDDLAKLLGQEGLADAEQLLLSTDTAAGNPELASHLRAMFARLQADGLSGRTFERAPAWFFGAGHDESWWPTLTYDLLRRVLDEVGASRPTGRLVVDCSNALNRATRLEGEPFLVYSDVDLQATAQRVSVVPATVTFTRRLFRSAPVRLPDVDGFQARDEDPPVHDRPLVYQVDAPLVRPGSAKVIVLDGFTCHGVARARDAVSNPPPMRRGAAGGYIQEIVLPRGGTHDLTVYRDPSGVAVRIVHQGEPSESGQNPCSFTLDIEDRDTIDVAVVGAGGATLGQWQVQVFVEEAGLDAPSTRFEALVRAHQEGKSRSRPVRPRDAPLRRMEDLYLSSRDSWRGVLACWDAEFPLAVAIDWSLARAGDVEVQGDIRPPLAVSPPPASYVAAREAVRTALLECRRTIGEATLSDATLVGAIEEYVREYGRWLRASPEAASWTDCIAVHAPTGNPQAGQVTATGEPLAILLSPLHPLRLGWHCAAQVMLEESLLRPCPLAGLLDSHSCPDSLSVPIFRGGVPSTWQAFFAMGSREPHWAILWNKDYLRDSPERRQVLAVLSAMGLDPSGVSGGFTESQAARALRDVRDILPARAVLRIGLTGSGEEASSCVDGLVAWFKAHFASENGEQPAAMPFAVEVYDYRANPDRPTAEGLAVLSEETGERVRWFKGDLASPAGPLDLVIMDQVGSLDFRALSEPQPSATRSAVAPAAAFRVRVREDLDSARFLKETRTGWQEREFGGIDGAVLDVALDLEELTTRDAGTTHLQFQPNQHAIGQRLNQSLFVALTSSQIDPACFIRGIRGQDAYLWDYELPGTMGFDEESAGYYLVARPPEALKKAISNTTSLVTTSPPPVEELLEEISRRGIPVLKRLANGGSHARGEMGVLLAVRLLQDVFRPGSQSARLPVVDGDCVHLLLPVDSYWEPLVQLRKALDPASSAERPDLLVFCIRTRQGEPAEIKITPLEVKFREGSPMSPGEIGAALGQAANLGALLETVWVGPARSKLWATCSGALLAKCLDHAFRVYADPGLHGREGDWAHIHERVIRDVVGQRAQVTVCRAGRLLVFDSSARTSLADMDGDGRLDTAVLCRADAEALLTGQGSLSAEGEPVVGVLDFSMAGWEARGPAEEPGVAAQVRPVVTPAAAEEPGASAGLAAETSVEAVEGGPATQVVEEQAEEDSEMTTAVEDPTVPSAVPAEVRQRVRQVFEGFIGNEPSVRRLSNDLLRALIERPPYLSKNYLFTGQPSTGKTELARRVARALALPFVRLEGRGVSRPERLIELVDGELQQQRTPPSQVATRAGLTVFTYPPLVVFIDEVHLVPRAVQESLLTMLEAADRTLTLRDRIVHIDRATFLFATTRPSDVDPAFKSRCTEIQLREYQPAEVAEILFRRHPDWPREILLRLANLGRCVPRIAIELANELETEMTVSETPGRSLDQHLEEVAHAREMDDLGLRPLDIQYLELLEREGRPMGEQAILNMLQSVDRDRILNEVEPFLVRRLHFAALGPRGREITLQGRDYLLARRRAGR